MNKNQTVKIVRKMDDPECARVSIGGNHIIGYYLVYRGDSEQVVTAIKAALCAFEGLIASEHIMQLDEEIICLIRNEPVENEK